MIKFFIAVVHAVLHGESMILQILEKKISNRKFTRILEMLIRFKCSEEDSIANDIET